MAAPDAAQFPIRTLARLTGVPPVTLRAWERRHGLLSPARTPAGHRRYTQAHVALIHRVRALLERGVAISEVRRTLAAERSPAAQRADAGPWRGWRERMAEAIARFDEESLDAVYDEALGLHPIERVTRRLLLPLLAELGDRWSDAPGGIAEEHFFAVYLRNLLGARFHHRRRPAAGPRLLAACGPGEHHEIGLLLFALAASEAGLRVVALGADTPLAEIAHAARRGGCDAVVVSHSLEPAPGVLERDLPELVRRAGVPVFVGGRTALGRHAAIVAAGAVPLGADIGAALRRILAALGRTGAPR